MVDLAAGAHPVHRRAGDFELLVLPPVEDVVGGKRRAIRPLHAFAKRDCPLAAVGTGFPAFGEMGPNRIAHRRPTHQRRARKPPGDDAHVAGRVGEALPATAIVADAVGALQHQWLASHALCDGRQLLFLDQFSQNWRLSFGKPGRGFSLRVIYVALHDGRILGSKLTSRSFRATAFPEPNARWVWWPGEAGTSRRKSKAPPRSRESRRRSEREFGAIFHEIEIESDMKSQPTKMSAFADTVTVNLSAKADIFVGCDFISLSSHFQREIIFGVGIADIANHGAHHVKIVGQFAVFHVAPDQIAQNAAKILVTRKRHERTRIRQHSDEA